MLSSSLLLGYLIMLRSFIKKSLPRLNNMISFLLLLLFNWLFLLWRCNLLLFFFTGLFLIFLLVFDFLKSRRSRFDHFNVLFKLVFDTTHMMFDFVFVLEEGFLLCFNFMDILFFVTSEVFAVEFGVDSNLPSDIFYFIELRNISDYCFYD